MSHIVLYWILTASVLGIGIFALRTKRARWPFRLFFGTGALALAIGCLCNTAVITANGGQMPVETGIDWSHAPKFLADAAPDSLLRRLFEGALNSESKLQPSGIHAEVDSAPEAVAKVRLAWLDDRYPLIVGDSHIIYSPGDVAIAIGTGILLVGASAGLLAALVRVVRRRKGNAT